ncbi:MAG TPA: GNAT family N-acetyltransferase [Steroidobacteraceae bacterium]|nr:GNAT family N-acetyltransferase [Steroidobacteraceae bacterium]
MSATNPSLRVRILGRDALESLRGPWTALWLELPAATPFNSWEWTAAWLATLGKGIDARFVLLESGDRLRGILPLADARRGGLGFVAPRTLRYCGVDLAYPDQLEPVCDPAELPAFLELALRAVFRENGLPSTLSLPMVAEDSPTQAALGALRAFRTASRAVSLAPYLPIAGTFEEFLGTLSSNERYKIRSRSKKLLTGKGAEYGPVPDLAPVQALQLLRTLHAKRSEQKGIESTFDTDAVQDFHAELLRIFPRERVVFRCLRKDGEIFAMFYGFVVANRLFYFQLGYDPKWSDSSPGLVLLSQTIRETFEIGCREYNFLQGNEPFKATWTKAARPLHDWTIYAPTLNGRLHRELDSAARVARHSLARFRRLKADDKGQVQGVAAHG